VESLKRAVGRFGAAKRFFRAMAVTRIAGFCLLLASAAVANNQEPVDPGPRPGPAGAGGPYPTLNDDERALFNGALDVFKEVDSVSGDISGEPSKGLGPTFNSNSCASCHAEPAALGTSPHPNLGLVRADNPQVAMASLDRVSGQEQVVPSFIRRDGPVREARFIRNPDGSKDGGVHGLYTIAGRVDAPGCNLAPPDFDTELANNNVIFRIPTPTFGLGLIENVPDNALVANLGNYASEKQLLGIGGKLNRTGNDGTVTRFGWKAQNKSLLIFVGEAYNVEQGVSNEIFPNERAAVDGCVFNETPEDFTSAAPAKGSGGANAHSDTVNFAVAIRLSGPPSATTSTESELRGAALFGNGRDPGIGCVLCHTDTLTTGRSPFTGMSNVDIHPYSDMAVHHMGPGLADFVDQGLAGPDDFRTAPLWGVGQRIFFLHDGRAGPPNGGLQSAIFAHRSTNPSCADDQLFAPDGTACRSEANRVIDRYEALSNSAQQDILNFLRSL
jgi:CxxC motif-containing protein (DUF1111 family)